MCVAQAGAVVHAQGCAAWLSVRCVATALLVLCVYVVYSGVRVLLPWRLRVCSTQGPVMRISASASYSGSCTADPARWNLLYEWQVLHAGSGGCIALGILCLECTVYCVLCFLYLCHQCTSGKVSCQYAVHACMC